MMLVLVYNVIKKRGYCMLSFYKNNSDSIAKLFVNQLGMTIFGHLLFAATFKTDLRIATGLLSSLFYLYLVYTTGWDIGAKDKIKVDGGRMDYTPHKGILLGIAANGIGIILSFINLTFYFLQFSLWAAGVSLTSYTIATLLNGMYASFFTMFESSLLKFVVLAAFLIPAIAVTGISYYAGLKNFRISVFLGLSKNKRK